MGIKEIINKLRGKRDTYKEMEFQDAAQRRIINRRKTLNESELEWYKERDRQERIKKELHRYRKRDSSTLIGKGNMIKNPYLFKDKKPILKNPYIFHNRNNFMGGRNLFT